MLYIKWKDEDAIGVGIVDEQHRGIVSVINSYHYMVRMGKPREALALTRGTLDEMTQIHFRTEEAILRAVGYPNLDAHADLHNKLVRNMYRIYEESIQHNDASMFLEFLKNWWRHHIHEEDKKYAEYIQSIPKNDPRLQKI